MTEKEIINTFKKATVKIEQLQAELEKANRQIEGYAELLQSANTDVENLKAELADAERANATLMDRIVELESEKG